VWIKGDQLIAHKQVYLFLRFLLSPLVPLCAEVFLPEGFDFGEKTLAKFDGLLLGVALP
jgi:hypothetical protein